MKHLDQKDLRTPYPADEKLETSRGCETSLWPAQTGRGTTDSYWMQFFWPGDQRSFQQTHWRSSEQTSPFFYTTCTPGGPGMNWR